MVFYAPSHLRYSRQMKDSGIARRVLFYDTGKRMTQRLCGEAMASGLDMVQVLFVYTYVRETSR